MLSGVRQWSGQELGTTAVIYKNESDSYSCKFIFNDINDQIDRWHFGSPIFTLTPLSSGAEVYRVEGKYNEDYSHFGNSGQLVFTISTRTIWDRGIIKFDFTGHDQFHMVKAGVSMAKTYPTPSQINGPNSLQPQQPSNAPEEWSGTGFALKNGYIITNYHVVEGASTITIQGVNGDFNSKFSASIVGTDKGNDLALLKISDANFSGFGKIPYSISPTTSDVGEEVFVLGYPLTSTMGDEIKLTTGIISSKTGYQGDVALYQISAPVQPGNSGGPLFDKNGNVIGVVSAKHAGAENVGYAVKASYLRNLIESTIDNNVIPSTNTVANLSLPAKVKNEKDFVYYIKCSSRNLSDNSRPEISNNSHETLIFENPRYDMSLDENLSILSVSLSPIETTIELACKNQYYDGWMSLDNRACLIYRGIYYPMTSVEGIDISPDKTRFSYISETKTFKIKFKPLPLNAASFTFMEEPASSWQITGIQLNENKESIRANFPTAYPASFKVIDKPSYEKNNKSDIVLNRIIQSKDFTILDLTYKTSHKNTCMLVDWNAHLLYDGVPYMLRFAEGMHISQDLRYFTQPGDETRVLLYFNPLPVSCNKFGFFETAEPSVTISGIEMSK